MHVLLVMKLMSLQALHSDVCSVCSYAVWLINAYVQ